MEEDEVNAEFDKLEEEVGLPPSVYLFTQQHASVLKLEILTNLSRNGLSRLPKLVF